MTTHIHRSWYKIPVIFLFLGALFINPGLSNASTKIDAGQLLNTDDGEQLLIAHLAGFNKGRNFTRNAGANANLPSSRVEAGEYIGVMGNTLSRHRSRSNRLGVSRA
jgi:hypothetical protein